MAREKRSGRMTKSSPREIAVRSRRNRAGRISSQDVALYGKLIVSCGKRCALFDFAYANNMKIPPLQRNNVADFFCSILFS